MRAHPRSRGENAVVRWQEPNRRGSSPLTRGKQCCCPCRSQRAGLIPAHAGKTPSRWSRTGRAPAHPRSRGENPTGARASTSASGSSPLTRGKQFLRALPRGQHGLIPAHAGKTSSSLWVAVRASAHPRSRGENRYATEGRLPGRGSSPLTRGKRPQRRRRFPHQRLIPAHAGKTPRRKRSPRGVRAHPRSRGENWHAMRKRSKGAGSSPLTRGKQKAGREPLAAWRLIPAHAGKTLSSPWVAVRVSAHPRSRGENPSILGPKVASSGSSPLTRGKPETL